MPRQALYAPGYRKGGIRHGTTSQGGRTFYPELVKELISEGETETGYAQVGALSIHEDLDKIRKMEERARDRKVDAPEIGEITRLNEEETHERFPLLRDGYHSVHISGAARVDGRALRDALIRSAQRNGAKLINGDAALLYQANRVTGAIVGASALRQMKSLFVLVHGLINCFQPLGIHFQVRFQKRKSCMQATDRQDTGTWPVVMPPSDQYLPL